MRIYNKTGSRERLFEMIQRVNKISINEGVVDTKTIENTLNSSFNDLISNKINIIKVNNKTNNDKSFVELVCQDTSNNKITFNFEVVVDETDIDDTFGISNARLINFSFTGTNGDFSVDESELNVFNKNNGDKIINFIADYVDVSDDVEIDTLYEEAINLIDKIPYKIGTEEMQTHSNYVDEKPTNPNLRVKSPQIGKYLDEINVSNIQYSKLSQEEKFKYIQSAKSVIDSLGMRFNNDDEYRNKIKEIAIILMENKLSGLNEDEYPEPIGKDFSTKSLYPKKKKPRLKKVKISEDEEPFSDTDTDERLNIGDVVTVEGIEGNFQIGVKYSEKKPFIMPYDINNKKSDPRFKIYLTSLTNPIFKKVLSYSETDGGFMNENDGMSLEPDVDDIEKLAQAREERGDEIEGGLGDDKSPLEFDPEQIKKGMKVEMEHTNDPLIALEIALDHLTEDPAYYTIKDNPEASAQAQASVEASDNEPHTSGAYIQDGMAGERDRNARPIPAVDPYFMMSKHPLPDILDTDGTEEDLTKNYTGKKGVNRAIQDYDKELTDELLGYKPKNVGESLDVEENFNKKIE